MTWSEIVVQAALKGALLVGIAGLATALLRHRSAALRHQIWTGAIIAQLALLALVPVLPRVSIPLLPRLTWSLEPRTTDAGDVGPAAADAASLTARTTTTSSTTAPSDAAQRAAGNTTPNVAVTPSHKNLRTWLSDLTWRSALVLIWLTGTTIVLLRFVVGTIVMARLARRGERVEDGSWLALTQRTANKLGIKRPLTLLRGDALSVPVTWGVIYPVVLLPAEAAQWSEERRRFVLVHEMAHVKRFDALTQLVAQLAVAVFWFSPLVWIAEQRMRVEREHACDDVVLGEGTRATTYADELLQMVRAMGTRQRAASAPAFAALAMARRSEFEGRMLAILDPSRPRSANNTRGVIVAALSLIAVAAPLAALSPFAAAPSPKTTVKTEGTAGNGNAATQPSAPGSLIAPNVAAGAKSVAKAQNIGTCSTASLKSGTTSTHLQVDDEDPSAVRLDFLTVVQARCLQANVVGTARFSSDETAVTSVSDGGSVFVRERTPLADRAVKIIPNGSGAMDYAYTEGGRGQEFDADARSWLARTLPEVMREAGVNPGARVTKAIRRGGLEEALSTIETIKSNSSKAEHYKSLVKSRTWSTDEYDRIIRSAGEELKATPNDIAAVLARLPKETAQTQLPTTSLGAALKSIKSSGDLRLTLEHMVPGADKETMLMLADVARNITSDGDKSTFLITAAPFYLPRRDDALRTAYFKVYETLSSSGDKQRVLMTDLTYARGNDALTRSILQGAKNIESSGDRAVVLVRVAQFGLVTTPALRDAFAAAASADMADGDRRTALEALLRGPNK